MHAGLVSKTLIENLCKINVEVDLASEFRYRNPIIDSNTLAIFISQSGETADTIAALELAKVSNAQTIAVTNVPESSITRIADKVLYTRNSCCFNKSIYFTNIINVVFFFIFSQITQFY